MDYKWPPLTFGWTLADVIKNTNAAKPALQDVDGKASKEFSLPSEQKEESKRSSSPILVDGNEELGDLSTKLLDKLNKEESKLRQKSNLEIGTWSNEMAVLEDLKKQNGHAAEEELEDFEDMFDPNIALPDNLTFIDDSVLPQINPEGNRRDWGTGIAQKKFRVGSPTFFSNPDINIPGLMDDMDGFSCSDSEDEDFYGTGSKKHHIDDNVAEVEDVGRVRIEFRGRNLAEAIEDEEQAQSRIATLAKNREEDLKMVSGQPWDLSNINLSDHHECLQFEDAWTFIKIEDNFDRNLPSKEIKAPSRQISASLRLPLLDVPPDRVINDNKDLSFGVLFKDGDLIPTFSFDTQPDLKKTVGPSPSLLLQALTMSNSNDVINLGEYYRWG